MFTVGTYPAVAGGMSGIIADIARLMVDWETPNDSPISAWVRLWRR